MLCCLICDIVRHRHDAFYTFVKEKYLFYLKYLLLVLLIDVGIFISFKLIQIHSYNQLCLLIFIESLINLSTLSSKMDEHLFHFRQRQMNLLLSLTFLHCANVMSLHWVALAEHVACVSTLA